jgi:probable addiction module antidote protein
VLHADVANMATRHSIPLNTRPPPGSLTAYPGDVFESGDRATIARAIGWARSMTKIAKEAALSRENSCRSLSGDTKPEFDTMQLEAKPKAA